MTRRVEEEPNPQSRIKRLLIEFADGKVRYLEGEAAQKHMEQIDNALAFMQLTRPYMLPEDFLQSDWQEIDISEAAELFQP